MFDPWCPTCSARVLLTARRLLTLTPTSTGHHARLRCWCGTEVSMTIERQTRSGDQIRREAA